jgi:rfaE bifunctional protein kinase chain/domain
LSDSIGVDPTVEDIRRLVPPGARTVFVSGNFNVLHPGHLRLIRFARECGEFLIVGVQSDALAGEAALLGESLRLEGVRSNNWIDLAFIMRQPARELIAALRPDVVVKGREHEHLDNPEREAVSAYGGRLLFGSGEISFSSVDLLRGEMPPAAKYQLPEDFPARHGFSRQDLRALVRRFPQVRMVVIGDLIVDEYIDCDPLGMSQEDPTIVVTPVYQQSYVGGAGIVAAHAASLGATVDYFSIAGRDTARDIAVERLHDYRVRTHLLEDESRPTTLKQRFRAQGKTLLRVSHLRQHGLSRELCGSLLDRLRPVLDQAHVLVFSDFNYGCLPQTLVDTVTALGRERELLMVADSQSSSQIGDVSRFRGMDLLTPTEREARISTHNHEDGLVVLAEALRRQAGARNLLMKLGAEGVIVHAELSKDNHWLTDRLPAFSLTARDTAGAGDSLLASSALALALRANLWQAAYLGSTAAACQVGRIGNVPLGSDELQAALGNGR